MVQTLKKSCRKNTQVGIIHTYLHIVNNILRSKWPRFAHLDDTSDLHIVNNVLRSRWLKFTHIDNTSDLVTLTWSTTYVQICDPEVPNKGGNRLHS